MHRPDPARLLAGALLSILMGLALAACGEPSTDATPRITPGTADAPREVNIIERDYGYSPPVIDLVPGETVLLHIINGGLDTHEAVFGSLDAQLDYERAEAATVGSPPGPTPAIASPPGFDGIRVVAGSGQRVDVTWTVPESAPANPTGWFVGCHIPGHWEKGMVVPIRFVNPSGQPLGTPPPIPLATPGGE
jgi:uncharacterized cupredoxin-like copper-binding protein